MHFDRALLILADFVVALSTELFVICIYSGNRSQVQYSNYSALSLSPACLVCFESFPTIASHHYSSSALSTKSGNLRIAPSGSFSTRQNHESASLRSARPPITTFIYLSAPALTHP
ncbi:hypothetical protein BJ546DRAFT_29597 [Cryomyces antarcticus]